MPSKSEHRARIRQAIMLAAFDLNHLDWTEDDDVLFDYLDKWLIDKDNLGRTISAAKESLNQLAQAQGQPQLTPAPPSP